MNRVELSGFRVKEANWSCNVRVVVAVVTAGNST